MARPSVFRASRSRPRAVAGVLSIVFVAALPACGSSSTSSSAASASASSSTATTGTPSSTATTSTGPTEAQKAADKATAEGSTLKLSDFPAGWVQEDKSSDSGSTCPSVEPAKRAASARASAPQFQKGDSDYASDGVYIYATVAEAQQAFPALSGSATRECIANQLLPLLRKNADGKAKVEQPTSGQMSAPPVGDDSVAGRVTVPFTVEGLSFSLNVDLRFVRVDRGVHILLFWTAPGTFAETLEAKLTRTATNRLKAQLTGNAA